MSGAAPALADAGVQALHVAARRTEATARPSGVPYVVLDFIDRMDLASPPRTWSSAGPAPTASPRPRPSGLPAIFVPLPIGNGEQDKNARPVVDAGGGAARRGAELTPPGSSRPCPPWSPTPTRLPRWAWSRAALIPRDADEKLARIVLHAARRGSR